MGSRQQMLLIWVRNSLFHTALLGRSSETNLGGGKRGTRKEEMTEVCGNLATGQQFCKVGEGNKPDKCPGDALLRPGPWQHGSPLTAAPASSHLASLPRDAADISWDLY